MDLDTIAMKTKRASLSPKITGLRSFSKLDLETQIGGGTLY